MVAVPFQHPRKLIRKAAQTMLLNKTNALTRVYRTRFLPFMPDKLPALSVYTLDTNTREGTEESGPRILEHAVDLIVEVAVDAAPEEEIDSDVMVDDKVDDIAAQVERVMGADVTIGGTSSDSWLASSVLEEVQTNDASYAILRMTFRTFYERGYPESVDQDELDDFLTGNVRTDVNDLPADDEAEDTITVPGPP
jgi:hypothetical protein